MININNFNIAQILNTSNYGLIKEGISTYDDQRILGEYLLNFKLYKIRCWTEENVGLSGLEIFYKDRITSQEVKTISVKKKVNDDEEQEIVLEIGEMINSIIIWKNDYLLGFEIKTNKEREKQFGWCGEGIKVELKEFEGRNNILCGFYCGFHKNDGIISMGYYYVNKIEFYLFFYHGILCLRAKLKNKEFKKNISKKLNYMNYSDKALYKACVLPDNQFFGIFKYIFF